MQLTLIAPAASRRGIRPAGYAMRPCSRDDIPALGNLYFASYAPGEACDTIGEAIADIAASFDGAYGEFWPEASPIVLADDELVAAVLTVRCAPWDDAPDCPFIIETFTAPEHRRRGLAHALLGNCLTTVAGGGFAEVALRVDADNANALRLYRDLGFTQWQAGGNAATVDS